jgi:hypothetical protein
MYYSVRIEVVTKTDSGKEKKHTEEYLADALTCTEAEARVVKHFEGIANFDYSVKAVRETKILDVLK